MFEGLAVADLSLFASTEEPVAGLAEETRLRHQQVQTCVDTHTHTLKISALCQLCARTSGRPALVGDVGRLTDGFARVVWCQGAGLGLCRGLLLLLLRRLPHCERRETFISSNRTCLDHQVFSGHSYPSPERELLSGGAPRRTSPSLTTDCCESWWHQELHCYR